jgi:hypothetical protein
MTTLYTLRFETRLYPQVLGFLSVASYDSQGYGEGTRLRLHKGFITEPIFFSRRTDFYSVAELTTELPFLIFLPHPRTLNTQHPVVWFTASYSPLVGQYSPDSYCNTNVTHRSTQHLQPSKPARLLFLCIPSHNSPVVTWITWQQEAEHAQFPFKMQITGPHEMWHYSLDLSRTGIN